MDNSQLFADVKCYIVDMDGTFYLGDGLLPGALRFADAVKKKAKDSFFSPTIHRMMKTNVLRGSISSAIPPKKAALLFRHM